MSEVAGPTRPPVRTHRAPMEPPPPPGPPEYEGLITRAIAFTIDAAIISAVSVVVGAAVGIVLSVLSVPNTFDAVVLAVGGGAWLLWSTSYFVTFWTMTGQTPGNRLLGIRVRGDADDERLPPRRALLRLIALTLCAIPLFAGFLPILFNDRRRGIHDMLARTVVVGATDDAP